MNWRKDLLARQSVFDSLALAAAMWLAGVLGTVAICEQDIYAFLCSAACGIFAARKGWRLWHALNRLARML